MVPSSSSSHHISIECHCCYTDFGAETVCDDESGISVIGICGVGVGQKLDAFVVVQ